MPSTTQSQGITRSFPLGGLMETAYENNANDLNAIYGHKGRVIVRSSKSFCEKIRKHALRKTEMELQGLLKLYRNTSSTRKQHLLSLQINDYRKRLSKFVDSFSVTGNASSHVKDALQKGGWHEPYLLTKTKENKDLYPVLTKESQTMTKKVKDILTKASQIDSAGGTYAEGIMGEVNLANNWRGGFQEHHRSSLDYLLQKINQRSPKSSVARRLVDRICCCFKKQPSENTPSPSPTPIPTPPQTLYASVRRPNHSTTSSEHHRSSSESEIHYADLKQTGLQTQNEGINSNIPATIYATVTSQQPKPPQRSQPLPQSPSKQKHRAHLKDSTEVPTEIGLAPNPQPTPRKRPPIPLPRVNLGYTPTPTPSPRSNRTSVFL